MEAAGGAGSAAGEGRPRLPGEVGRGHLTPLPGTSLGLWPWAALRGAGFPAALLEPLAAPELAARIDALLDGAAVPQEELAARFAAESRRIRAAVQAAARDPRFREAVMWQNRQVVHTMLDPLARVPVEDASRSTRRREQTAALYLQRYCVKNDSIGFFGPIGWARVTQDPEAIVARPGPGLVHTRAVYFEGWAIDALAEALSARPELRPWAAPRLLPYARLEGTTLHVPGLDPVELGPAQAAALVACDGQTPARAIAARLAADPALGLSGDEGVFELLERAAAMDLIAWGFEPHLQLHPEAALRRALEAVGDEGARAPALAALAELEDARAGVAAAAGDADALDRAMGRLDATFTALTGAAPTRRAGEMYAQRTLVYEDCRRDLDLALGAPLLERLAPPLALVLQSARWVTREIARRYDPLLRGLFDRLARLTPANGPRQVDLAAFHAAFAEHEPELQGIIDLSETARGAQDALAARWAEILAPPPGARRLHYRSEELRAPVAEVFAAPGPPPWSLSRYFAPDLMIAADGVEAIRRGELQLVLGELHLSHTVQQSCLVAQHPSPEALLELRRRDFPEPPVLPLTPKVGMGQRTSMALLHEGYLVYVFSRDPAPVPPARTLRVADLVVVERGGALEVASRDGRYRCGLMEFGADFMSTICADIFTLLPRARHTPRVTVDDLVVARESWYLPAAELLGFAAIKDPLSRWIEARRTQRAHGMPRRVFVRSPLERKPTFVDFDSPLLVSALVKTVRLAAEHDPEAALRVTEMLPGPEALWLEDAEGRRYTSELRVIAYDLEGLPPQP